MNINDARRRVAQLHADLQRLVERDPDQEVWEPAVSVLDAVLQVARNVVPNDDPVVTRIDDFISARSVTAEQELRAADALVVVGQVMAAIPPSQARQRRPGWVANI